MVLLVAALVAAEGSPSGRVGGPSGCSAGGKLCCPYNRSVFHSRIVPPAYGGPAPFRLDQHYTIDAVDDVTYSFTSANGTFADTVITVDPPADNCNRVNCTACAACGLPCGGNKADELPRRLPRENLGAGPDRDILHGSLWPLEREQTGHAEGPRGWCACTLSHAA